jgi:hypothetical protein
MKKGGQKMLFVDKIIKNCKVERILGRRSRDSQGVYVARIRREGTRERGKGVGGSEVGGRRYHRKRREKERKKREKKEKKEEEVEEEEPDRLG